MSLRNFNLTQSVRICSTAVFIESGIFSGLGQKVIFFNFVFSFEDCASSAFGEVFRFNKGDFFSAAVRLSCLGVCS